jgi:hypothetical protein
MVDSRIVFEFIILIFVLIVHVDIIVCIQLNVVLRISELDVIARGN